MEIAPQSRFALINLIPKITTVKLIARQNTFFFRRVIVEHVRFLRLCRYISS